MVSTRSQSRLSGSSMLKGIDALDGTEVTSKIATAKGSKRSSRRRSGHVAPAAAAALEAIAEEAQAPLSATETCSRPKVASDLQVNNELMDKLAADIFANVTATETSSSSDEENGDDASRDRLANDDSVHEAALHWKPALRLPEGDEQRAKHSVVFAQHGTDPRSVDTSGGILAEKQGSTSKLLHVPAPDERARAKAARAAKSDTAGRNWFGLPAATITEEVKTDLRVLRLRSAYDPKTFYKKFDDTKFPKYFQFGTVVEGAADSRSDRLSRKQRKRTLAEEILADQHLTSARKKRYSKLQQETERWAGRPAGRKTDNPRRIHKPRRPKH
jgi:hypothetical protein